jgi:hypothetical protein
MTYKVATVPIGISASRRDKYLALTRAGYRIEGAIDDLFLNTYKGALVCWSLLWRNKYYGGPLLTVLRDSDDVEMDFYPVFNSTYGLYMVDLAGILAFCGASIGYVSKRWDQTGNGHHQTQTVKANCPKICESSAIITKNGFPAIDFDGVSDYMDSAANILGTTTAFSCFSVGAFKEIGQNTDYYWSVTDGGSGSGNNWIVFRQSTSNNNLGQNSTPINIKAAVNGVTDSNQKLFYCNYVGGSALRLGINGTIVENTTSIGADSVLTSKFRTGATGADASPIFHGAIYEQETIIYKADKSADQAAMRADINATYGIY